MGWTRAFQRQIARGMTPGKVVFLPSYCIFHPGRLPGWSGPEQSRGRLQGKSHLAGWYSSHPIVFSTLGGCQGGVDQSIPEADCKGDDTWQGGVPPILLHCPPWEVARVEWTRAIQRQIARKMTPGRVVFLPSYCVSTLGGCQGGVDQRNPEADCKKVTPGRLDSSYCVPPIPILHKFQFSHMFFCRRPLL